MKASFIKKSATVAASILAIGLASNASALAVSPFTLSPGAVSPTLFPTSFTADTLSGVSTELLTAGPTGTTGSGYLLFTAATLNGTPVYTGFSQQGNPTPGQYNLYVTFSLSDTGTGAIGQQNTVKTLDFQFYIDTQRDDTFTPATAGLNSSSQATISGGANDTLLAYGSLISGVDGFDTMGGAYLNSMETFNICSGAGTAKNGATTIASTTCKGNFGTSFFSAPVPFYQLAFDGFNNNGNPSNVQRGSGTTGNQIAINSAVGNISFSNVPEPSSLALFGIAAVGLGLGLRRRKA